MGEPVQKVRVIVRIRPLSMTEKNMSGVRCLTTEGDPPTTIVLQATQKEGAKMPAEKKTAFDYVFGEDSQQVDVFNEAAVPLITAVLEGYNGTIMAYGNTGSGKTHTMKGDPFSNEQRGIIPRTLERFFELTGDKSHFEQARIDVCYVQDYKGRLMDLLVPANDKIVIREKGIDGVVWKTVENARAAMKHFDHGNGNRVVGAHSMNSVSSRSHAIFIVKVFAKKVGSAAASEGSLLLVDLAGSERAATAGTNAEMLDEAKYINQSLSTLALVVQQIVKSEIDRLKGAKNKPHISFRSSNLTHLLAPSLRGSALCLMMLAMSPSPVNNQDALTLSTIQFGESAKKMPVKAQVNPVIADMAVFKKMIAKLRDENAALKAELEKQQQQQQQQQQAGAGAAGGLAGASGADGEEDTAFLAMQASWHAMREAKEKERQMEINQKLQEDLAAKEQELEAKVKTEGHASKENQELRELLKQQREQLESQQKEMESSLAQRAENERLRVQMEKLQEQLETRAEQQKAAQIQGEQATVAEEKQTTALRTEMQRMEEELSRRQEQLLAAEQRQRLLLEELKRTPAAAELQQMQQQMQQAMAQQAAAAAAAAAAASGSAVEEEPDDELTLAFRELPDSLEQVVALCRLYPPNKVRFMNMGGLPKVVEAISANDYACYVLSQVCDFPMARDEVRQLGAFNEFPPLLASRRENESHWQNVCMAIEQMCEDNVANQQLIGGLCLGRLADLLKKSFNQRTQQTCAAALSKLSQGSLENKHNCARLGVLDRLIELISLDNSPIPVKKEATAALSILAEDETGSNKEAIHSKGGLKALVTQLSTSKDPLILSLASTAVFHLILENEHRYRDIAARSDYPKIVQHLLRGLATVGCNALTPASPSSEVKGGTPGQFFFTGCSSLGEWRGVSAGGRLSCPTHRDNPQYRLFVAPEHNSGEVSIVLLLVDKTKITKKRSKQRLYLGMTVYPGDSSPEKKLDVSRPLHTCTTMSMGENSLAFKLPPHPLPYAINVYHTEPGVFARYAFAAYSTGSISVEQVSDDWAKTMIAGQWRGLSRGGASNTLTFRNNPQFSLTVDTDTPLFLSLDKKEAAAPAEGSGAPAAAAAQKLYIQLNVIEQPPNPAAAAAAAGSGGGGAEHAADSRGVLSRRFVDNMPAANDEEWKDRNWQSLRYEMSATLQIPLLKAGVPYTIIPCADLPYEGDFVLSVYSLADTSVTPLTAEDEWNVGSVRGTWVAGRGGNSSLRNPQVQFTPLDESVKVVMLLRAPPEEAVDGYYWALKVIQRTNDGDGPITDNDDIDVVVDAVSFSSGTFVLRTTLLNTGRPYVVLCMSYKPEMHCNFDFVCYSEQRFALQAHFKEGPNKPAFIDSLTPHTPALCGEELSVSFPESTEDDDAAPRKRRTNVGRSAENDSAFAVANAQTGRRGGNGSNGSTGSGGGGGGNAARESVLEAQLQVYQEQQQELQAANATLLREIDRLKGELIVANNIGGSELLAVGVNNRQSKLLHMPASGSAEAKAQQALHVDEDRERKILAFEQQLSEKTAALRELQAELHRARTENERLALEKQQTAAASDAAAAVPVPAPALAHSGGSTSNDQGRAIVPARPLKSRVCALL